MTHDHGHPPLPPTIVGPLLVSMAVVLHLAGPGPIVPAPLASPTAWADWVDQTAPIGVAFRVVRLLATVACYHLMAMQIVASLASRLGQSDLVGFANRLTPPPLRTSARRLAGIGLTAVTSLTVPGARAGAEPVSGLAVMQVVDAGGGTASITVVPPVADPAPTSSGTAVLRLEAAPSPPAAQALDADEVHVVRPGDHLWAIAASALGSGSADPPNQAAVERYWEQLVLANPQLADPDLVFPGDVITLPPVSHTG